MIRALIAWITWTLRFMSGGDGAFGSAFFNRRATITLLRVAGVALAAHWLMVLALML
jgi:hypothetical protein